MTLQEQPEKDLEGRLEKNHAETAMGNVSGSEDMTFKGFKLSLDYSIPAKNYVADHVCVNCKEKEDCGKLCDSATAIMQIYIDGCVYGETQMRLREVKE